MRTQKYAMGSKIFFIIFNILCADAYADTASSVTDIRTVQKNDEFHYASAVAGSGTAMTSKLVQRVGDKVINPHGKVCTEHRIMTRYEGVGGPVAIEFRQLYFQDERNSIYNCGFFDSDSGKYIFIEDSASTPGGVALKFESPMKLGNTSSNIAAYTDGSWRECTQHVDTIETVVTKAGEFEAFRLTENCVTDEEASGTSTTVWFVPSLFTVKEEGKGEVISGNFTLESYEIQ